jgi:CRISPR type IV-associated protein Csf3
MATNQPFYVNVGLQTPVVLGQRAYLTLDSVLAALIYADTGDVEAAHRDIPLARTDAVWHGSAAFFDSIMHRSTQPAFKRSIEPREEMWAPAYQTGTGRNSNKPRPQRVDTQRGKYKSDMDHYTGIAASTLRWFGCGDIAAVRDLLDGLRFVGKKSRHGWGQVARIDIDEATEDLSLLHAQGAEAQPMRPIPVVLWEQMGQSSQGLLQRTAPVAPPYFDEASSTRCVVPSSRTVPWARRLA